MKKMSLLLLAFMVFMLIAGCTKTPAEPTPSPVVSPVSQETSQPTDDAANPEASPVDALSPIGADGAVILYFGNADATAVAPEARTIDIPEDITQADFIKLLVEQLIAGPENPGLSSTIPQTVKVLETYTLGPNAYVDFSEEMLTDHSGGAAGESMTIYSIVSTLTELEGIEGVMMTVVGQPMNIEHMVIDAPMERDESMIEQ